MKDMLVRLVEIPDSYLLEKKLDEMGILIRRPIAPEKSLVKNWVNTNFGTYWANEVDVAFSFQPPHLFIAQKKNKILGFACYETTAKNFFGPTGTLEAMRGKGIGKVLLLKSLNALKEMGYAYAIIGGVGPADFYKNVVDAKIIEHSDISIYRHLLKKKS